MDKVKNKLEDQIKERKTVCPCRNSCQKGTEPKRAGCPCKDEGLFCIDHCDGSTNVTVSFVCKIKTPEVEPDYAGQRKRETGAELVSDFENVVIDESHDDTFEDETPGRRWVSSEKSATVATRSDVRKDKNRSRIKKTSLRKQIHEIKNGFALVIHNKNYLHLRPREGSEKDLEAIEGFCAEAGIELDVKEDLKVSEIRSYCKKLTIDEGDKFRHYDGFICFVLAAGERTGIWGIDDELISTEEIVSYFQENTELLGKPKLFFIQACRGAGMIEDDGDAAEQKGNLLPLDSWDILIAQSTIKGRLSYRDIRSGSRFIQTLMKQFKTHAHSEHVMDIMILVNEDIAGCERGGYIQIPIQVSTLTKFVYFSMANND